jgi:endoglucanase
VAQSTRGYEPMEITHWKAEWVAGSEQWPEPTWPLPVPPETAASGRAQTEAFRQVFRDNPIAQRGLADHDPGATWDRARLEKQLVRPWRELEVLGVPVHVGEFGAHNQTPHRVVLPWMRDLLSLWKEAGWGWALWNLRGSFGILDSERPDVKYEDSRGHKLDRAMLELLQES